MEDIIHFFNFDQIRNRAEVPFLMQAALNGAEQAGYTGGIIFLNYEESKGILKMENKFSIILENLEEEETLTLGDQTF